MLDITPNAEYVELVILCDVFDADKFNVPVPEIVPPFKLILPPVPDAVNVSVFEPKVTLLFKVMLLLELPLTVNVTLAAPMVIGAL